MTKAINFTILNKLVIEKRDMNIYHHSRKSAHMISYNSTVTLPLKPVSEDDFLYISIVRGPGDLKTRSIVNLPAWINFDFLSEGKLNVTHSNGRTLLKIPPGLPEWQLKLSWSASHIDHQSECITVSDDQPD